MKIFNDIFEGLEFVPEEVKKLFTSDAAEAAIKEIATLAVKAQPYVLEVQAFVGKVPVVAGLIKAYENYALPYAQSLLTQTPAQLVDTTNALVVTLMQKNGVQASTVAHLQAAVTLAKAVVATATAPAATAA